MEYNKSDAGKELQMRDYHQEVANTGFGDMLHDTERNEKYELGLRAAIAKVHAAGKKAHVLDIGTGTGILAMMAVRAGADTVHACERFLPMANCAERILQLNNMSDKIRLIKKNSFDMKIGVDMPRKANILVAELLDTELIGEGVIPIYNNAHKYLLSDDVICIPNKAVCYVQLCSSTLSESWNSLKIIVNDDCNKMLEPCSDILKCRGTMSLHDMQVSMLPRDYLDGISVPQPVFTFDFSSKTPISLSGTNELFFEDVEGACLNTVVFWWDIYLDSENKIKISCAPIWARPADEVAKLKGKTITTKDIPWRDHWMQALFYLPKPLDVPVVAGLDKVPMGCNHDTYSFWFDETDSLPPRCECYFHVAHSRNRIGQLNDLKRNKKYVRFITEKFVPEINTTEPPIYNVLTLGDSCLVGLTHAWSKCVNKIYAYEFHRFSRSFIRKMASYNEFDNVVMLHENLVSSLKADVWKTVTHVFGEPYFHDNEMPWDNMGKFALMFYELSPLLSPNVKTSPYAIKIYAMPMEFDHLYKLRQPTGIVCGFDMTPFDEMLAESRKYLPQFEAHSLWEYEGTPLALPTLIHTFILREKKKSVSEAFIKIERKGKINGIAFWVECLLDDSNDSNCVVSGGPNKPVCVGKPVEWNMFERQVVYFTPTIDDVSPEQESVISISVCHDPSTNKYEFKFDKKNSTTTK